VQVFRFTVKDTVEQQILAIQVRQLGAGVHCWIDGSMSN